MGRLLVKQEPGSDQELRELCSLSEDSWNPARACGRKVAWELNWNRIRGAGQIRRWTLRQLGIMTVIWGLSYFVYLGYVHFKSFREVKFYCTSVQSPCTVSGKHVPGWQNEVRAWGWEAVSRRGLERSCLVSGSARDGCGRSWDHASQGQGDRYLMAFLGGRCLRAEMCI